MNHGLDFSEDFRGDFQGAAFRLDRESIRGKRLASLWTNGASWMLIFPRSE